MARQSAPEYHSFVQFRLILANVKLILFCSANVYSAQYKWNESVMYNKREVAEISSSESVYLLSSWHVHCRDDRLTYLQENGNI